MAKRTTITNGLRPWRYLFGVLGVFFFIHMLQNLEFTSSAIIFLVLFVLFCLLYFSRWVSFDDMLIYRTFGRADKAVSFTRIESVTRSRMKLNGNRMWKVTYLDEAEQESKFWFLEGVFQYGRTEEFIKAVQLVQPSVVVWTHPFLGHPIEGDG
ncbi:MAG: hypothetical protein ACJAYA_000496 [Bacteroidia bacterium]|jgi:hypothetical protein